MYTGSAGLNSYRLEGTGNSRNPATMSQLIVSNPSVPAARSKHSVQQVAGASASDVSVIICTYNGASRLPALLEKLRAQQTNCQINYQTARQKTNWQWEVIVVDNNSSDAPPQRHRQRIAELIVSTRQNWHDNVPLRYFFESERGLAFARRRAVRESQATLLAFLDDDTLPEPDWVSQVYQFAQQHPEAGAFGSSIRGLYEVPPPANFHRIACCLAIIDRGQKPFQYDGQRGVLPAGAGMVIRRQAWLEQVPEQPALAGVKAGCLKAKGEDVETLSYIRRRWQVWHNPAMQLTHIIPKARLERSYLLRLFWYVGLSRYQLRKLNYPQWQWPVMVVLHSINDLKKIVLYLFHERLLTRLVSLLWARRATHNKLTRLSQSSSKFQISLNTVESNTVEACELTLLVGTFLSPLFAFISFMRESITFERIVCRRVAKQVTTKRGKGAS